MVLKKIAIVGTNNDRYSNTSLKTGLWLAELVHFYSLLEKQYYKMDIISPNGGQIPLEPKSLKWPFIDRETKRYFQKKDFRDQLKNSLAVKDIDSNDYCAIFFTGGHGVMWDFPGDQGLLKLSAAIYEAGGVVSAVCHGVCALLNIKLGNGKRLIDGKKITGFSNLEEYVALVNNKVPYFLEDELKLRGAIYSKAVFPMLPYSVIDQRLITGQNPNSTKKVALNLIKELTKV